MATKSMLKTVTIKTKTTGVSLADALEKSIQQKEHSVEYKTRCKEVKRRASRIFLIIIDMPDAKISSFVRFNRRMYIINRKRWLFAIFSCFIRVYNSQHYGPPN